ncbi:MAG: lipopolysaccharide heptosyltransferase II [Desulfobacterales bacterium]|nr:lipopolysaccharide heptosyltransferase II [Desulfobacterales bacterium]
MKILVVAPSWVGDMTMAQSLFKKCRSDWPGAVIDVVAPEWSLPLLYRMAEIRNAVALPVGHGQLRFFKRLAVGRALQAEGYDWAIITPRTWKSALVPFFAGIPKRTGYTGEWRFGLLNDRRRLDRAKLDKTILRLLALAQERHAPLPPAVEFYPALTVDRENQRQLKKDLNLAAVRPVVCFCPGAEYGPAKQWPIPFFQRLAEMLIDAGYQVWTLGSGKEVSLGKAIHPGKNPWYHNLCGKTRLEDTIDLMGCADHVVSNDSGLMHVAAAINLPLQVIYGSSSPSYTPPLSTKARIHCLGIECSPCFKRKCPYGHYNCLYGIFPEQVYQSIVADQHINP